MTEQRALTEAEIAAMVARAEAATAGPWVVYPDHQATVCIEKIAGTVEIDCPSSRDALFVAHARDDVPRLAADLRRAREALTILFACFDRDDMYSYSHERKALAEARAALGEEPADDGA